MRNGSWRETHSCRVEVRYGKSRCGSVSNKIRNQFGLVCERIEARNLSTPKNVSEGACFRYVRATMQNVGFHSFGFGVFGTHKGTGDKSPSCGVQTRSGKGTQPIGGLLVSQIEGSLKWYTSWFVLPVRHGASWIRSDTMKKMRIAMWKDLRWDKDLCQKLISFVISVRVWRYVSTHFNSSILVIGFGGARESAEALICVAESNLWIQKAKETKRKMRLQLIRGERNFFESANDGRHAQPIKNTEISQRQTVRRVLGFFKSTNSLGALDGHREWFSTTRKGKNSVADYGGSYGADSHQKTYSENSRTLIRYMYNICITVRQNIQHEGIRSE